MVMSAKQLLICLVLLALVGCGEPTNTHSAPATCPQDDFLVEVQQYLPAATFVNTTWEPSPGTDLEAAINAGGAACSYGIQEAEIGTTILWAEGSELFASRSAQWEKDGYQLVNVDGVDEGWALFEETEVEQHLWVVNLLVESVWIQVNATFLSDLEEAQDLLDAAIAVTKTS